MNHRFLLRLVTNFAICLLTLSCFGIVLWVIDEIVGWDILPDAWSLLVRALLVAGGIIAFVMVIMNVMLSLALMAESNAARAALPNYVISRRLKRRVRRSLLAGVVAIALLLGGLQVINQVRAQSAVQAAEAKFYQNQIEMDQSVDQILDLFTPPLLEAIDTNTLAEKGQLGNLRKLLISIQSSFPQQPSMAILTPATQEPYKYTRIDTNTINANQQGQLYLSPKLYTSFPSEQETQVIEQLFSGKLSSPTEPLAGQVINNTVPSSWGVLKHEGQVAAVVYLQAGAFDDYGQPFQNQPPYRSNNRKFHHDGPDSLLSN
ncbi:MAG: hypothetical protein AAF152_11945 [Cyanobacteria bacterium P01_A01_bin.114]